MSLRPLEAHPVFLPGAALVAALLAVIAAAAIVVAPHSNLNPTSAPAPAGIVVNAHINRVLLAGERGGRDVVAVTAGGEQIRLVLDVDSRIVVPYNGRDVLGGPESLQDGANARIELNPGQRLAAGAGVAEIRVISASTVDPAES